MPEYIGIVPSIENSIPIIGSIEITGGYKVGSSLSAKLVDCYYETEYTVNWYRDSQLVATGETYALTDEDKESFIYATVTGKGAFSGTIQSQSITVLKDGTAVLTYGYIPEESIDPTLMIMILVAVVAISLTGGMMLGMKKYGKQS
jgi:hypothetical protein